MTKSPNENAPADCSEPRTLTSMDRHTGSEQPLTYIAR